MFKNRFLVLTSYPVKGIKFGSWSIALHGAAGFFVFNGAYYLQGVLHSSSLPDYIEDKKSGGQQTNCLNKNLCNDSTINTGLADRMIKQMPKTVMRG